MDLGQKNLPGLGRVIFLGCLGWGGSATSGFEKFPLKNPNFFPLWSKKILLGGSKEYLGQSHMTGSCLLRVRSVPISRVITVQHQGQRLL